MLVEKGSPIIVEGPDRCGKTEIAKALAKSLYIPYFKALTERSNWDAGKFKEALEHDQVWASQFFEQTHLSAVLDRMYPSEFVYSRVFGRPTNPAVLEEVDMRFSRARAAIVLCVRRDYSVADDDELVPRESYRRLHDAYIDFEGWTRCSCVKIYVDDFYDDISLQLPEIMMGLDEIWKWKGSESNLKVTLERRGR